MFFVSREAESEATATYKPLNCAADEFRPFIISRGILGSLSKEDRQIRLPSGYRVWFNPESDVIYFGPKTCHGGLIAFLKLGLPNQRIAFDAEARFDGNYCSRDCCHTTIAGKTCL
jgi:hypothetical protein